MAEHHERTARAGGPGPELDRYVVPLAEAGLDTGELIGRKAATLAELAHAGYRVPEGLVLSTAAMGRVLPSGRNASMTAEIMRELPLPDEVEAAIRSIADHFGGTPVAVRSSGVAEDLPGMSFAGQYETVLAVHGYSQLVEAVRTCWASAFADRVLAYRKSASAGAAGAATRMAVLVQRMVPARVAGVAFSVNPVNGQRSESVVSAVIGLGEQLVSGQVSPDEWVVGTTGAARRQSGSLDAIDGPIAQSVADLAASVEAYFGWPQDIEWAIDHDGLWLLQARPITALPDAAPDAVAAEVPPGRWRRDMYIRRPLTPMQRSIMLPVLNEASHLLFTFNIVDRLESREIGGWLYTKSVLLSGHERVVAQIDAIGRAAADREPQQLIERWDAELAPALARRSRGLADIDLAALTDDGAIDHLAAVQDLYQQAQDAHFRVGGAILYLWSAFGATCGRLLGWDAARSMRLVTGLTGKAAEPTVRLARLTAEARKRPAVRDVLAEAAKDTTMAELATANPGFHQELQDYLHDFGDRTLSIDLTDPTLGERPAFVLNLIRDQLDRDFTPSAGAAALAQGREEAEAEAREILAGRDPADQAAFDAVLADARRSYPVRDDKAFYTSIARGLLRHAIRDIGRRLGANGRLGTVDDVFLLERDEMVRALTDGAADQGRVARRSGELAWARAHPGPATYELEPEPEPETGAGAGTGGDWRDRLSPKQRRIVTIITWMYDAENEVRPSQLDAPNALSGIAASPGRYTGPARLIRDESEFDRLQPGDVLFCHETNPQWAVLFPNVGGLVTYSGGLLSHAAIIAREYRVPAVVAVHEAIERVTDGQQVTVDGTTGEVEILS
jgi:pyruvate,water dikinase